MICCPQQISLSDDDVTRTAQRKIESTPNFSVKTRASCQQKGCHSNVRDGYVIKPKRGEFAIIIGETFNFTSKLCETVTG